MWEVKAQFDDRVILVREVGLPNGGKIPVGTHGFVIEAIGRPEQYEVEFDLDDRPVLVSVSPEEFRSA
jgi:hypothetical protein